MGEHDFRTSQDRIRQFADDLKASDADKDAALRLARTFTEKVVEAGVAEVRSGRATDAPTLIRLVLAMMAVSGDSAITQSLAKRQ